MSFLTGGKEISTGVIFFLWCVLFKLQVNIIVSRSPHKMNCLKKKKRKGKDQTLSKVQSRKIHGGVGIFISSLGRAFERQYSSPTELCKNYHPSGVRDNSEFFSTNMRQTRGKESGGVYHVYLWGNFYKI